MSFTLHIEPPERRPLWEVHPWHKAIAAFRLPPRELSHHRNARLIPDRLGLPEQADGALYDRNGRLLEQGRHLRRGKVLNAAAPDTLAERPEIGLRGRFLYLGWFFNHYGHFLLESLGRLWALEEADAIDGVLFHGDSPPARPLLRILALAGLEPARIHLITEPIEVETLLVPSQRSVLGRAMGDETLALLQRLAENAWRRERPAPTPRLYVSRRLLADSQRIAGDEAHLESHFRKRGYQVIHPQFLDPVQQLALYRQATHFAGLDGSGLHNLLFARAPQNLWMLGAENRLADAITQVTIARWRHCPTTLVLGTVPASDCLPPQITPYLLPPEAPEPVPPTPWQRLRWLRALAFQLRRRVPDCADQLAQDLNLDDEAKTVLQAELADQTPAGEGTLARLARALRQNQPLEPFLADHADDPDFLLTLAKTQSDPAAAHKAAALAPEDPRPLLALALLEQDPQKALQGLQAVVRRWPAFRPGVIALCERLAANEAFTEAAEALERILEPRPEQARLWSRLAWYRFRAGHLDVARVAARQALTLEPDNPFSAPQLARIELAAGRLKEALEWVDRALRQTPEKPELVKLRQEIQARLTQCDQ